MKKKIYIENAAAYLILTVILICTVFPLIYTIACSFKTNSEILLHPDMVFPIKPTLNNYITAWNSKDFHVGILLWNSIYYTLLNVIIVIVSSSFAGYVFARGHFPLKKTIFACFTALMFIKSGGIGIYALFQILDIIHLNRSLWALIILSMFSVPIVNTYLVRGYINTLPKEIDEAAKIDGCSFIGIFFKIIAPLITPILATIGILAFQASWNDYIMPTIFTLTQPKQRTLIVGLMALKNSSGAATSWNLMLAGATIALIPVLGAYAVANRYFVSGLAAGAVKG